MVPARAARALAMYPISHADRAKTLAVHKLGVATKKNPKPCQLGVPSLLPQLRLYLGGGILSGDGGAAQLA